jgi:hypothetical protein
MAPNAYSHYGAVSGARLVSRRSGIGFSTVKTPLCQTRRVLFEKSLKIIIMGFKLAENGEPEDPFP